MKDYATCEASPDGQHVADPDSIQPVRGMSWVVDVNCENCGQSTGVRIDPDTIHWD